MISVTDCVVRSSFRRECIVSNINTILFIFYVHCASNLAHKRYPGSYLSPGTLTAPERFCLVLLRSRPDTVHRVPSRETQTSTSLSGGSPADCRPLRNITPAIADCRFKVPLPPRLHGLLFYMINECLSSMLLFLLHKIPHDFIPLCYRLCASAFFFIFLASLSSLKNCFINWLHSSSNTPVVRSA